MNFLFKLSAAFAVYSCSTIATAATVEVLHSWTSEGEAKAVEVLKSMLAERGHTWKDFAVQTGGDNAQGVLKQRIIQGKAPAAAMMKKFNLQRWERLGFLQNIDDIAAAGHWDDTLFHAAEDAIKFKGHYAAAAVGIHRTNWIWANKKILDKVGAKMPETWPEFFATAEKIKAAGYHVVAIGDEADQLGTMFESMILSVGGPELYRKAIAELDYSAIKSPEMSRVFDMARKLQPYLYMDSDSSWNRATKLVIDSEATFQFMGDWAKGEFSVAGKVPMKDYICAPVMQTRNQFLYNVDSLAMFKLHNAQEAVAQKDLASAIMSSNFQLTYNRYKGSIPARQDLDLEGFDICAQMSKQELLNAEATNAELPSIAHGLAATELVQAAFNNSISAFFHDPNMSSEKAALSLSKNMRKGAYMM
ncbi:ABC transporter substrate-binding protein [Gynuella sp.]|uniref:ABC transporter substrate-binding protein n=1 Tax=Gynuella sp. TaxID=2969146 RepID=UPI003D095B04